MQGVITESIAELLALLLYAGLAVVLTFLGALAELASLEDLSAGQSAIGLWEVAVGTLLLYAAYNVVTGLLVPRLRGADDADA